MRVYTAGPDGNGVSVCKHIDPEGCWRHQAAQTAAPNETAAARAKVNLKQAQFSDLLGVGIDTVQNWE